LVRGGGTSPPRGEIGLKLHHNAHFWGKQMETGGKLSVPQTFGKTKKRAKITRGTQNQKKKPPKKGGIKGEKKHLGNNGTGPLENKKTCQTNHTW